MIEFDRLVTDVLNRLESNDVGYAVVGSVAASAWGLTRMTHDADLVVLATVESTSAVVDELSRMEHVVCTEIDVDAAVETGESANIIDTELGGKVDIFFVPAHDPFTRSRIARRVRVDVFDTPMYVATPEDIILAKLRWRLESRSERQWQDCCDLAAANDLDEEYLIKWGAELGVFADLRDLLEQVQR